jgi:hypothetical protein
MLDGCVGIDDNVCICDVGVRKPVYAARKSVTSRIESRIGSRKYDIHELSLPNASYVSFQKAKGWSFGRFGAVCDACIQLEGSLTN